MKFPQLAATVFSTWYILLPKIFYSIGQQVPLRGSQSVVIQLIIKLNRMGNNSTKYQLSEIPTISYYIVLYLHFIVRNPLVFSITGFSERSVVSIPLPLVIILDGTYNSIYTSTMDIGHSEQCVYFTTKIFLVCTLLIISSNSNSYTLHNGLCGSFIEPEFSVPLISGKLRRHACL